ncbi:MAG: HlyD family efflux transporter periplasmic adaptor subunit [Spirosomataceae bacterium]
MSNSIQYVLHQFSTRCLVLAGGIGVLWACQKTETTSPQYRPIVEAVYASGKVLPMNDYKIYVQADGMVTQQLVSEGDAIRAGQVLFRIESNNQLARLTNAQEIYRQAQSNLTDTSPVLQEIASQLESAKAKLRDDSTNYLRYQALWNQGATAKINVDKAQLAYQVSKNDVVALRQRYQRTRNQLKIDLENAKATQRISSNDEANYAVKSSIDGLVYEVYRKQGEAVRRNDALASVGKANQFYLQLWVDEQDIEKIKIGQEIAIKMDMHKGKVFRAKVSKIFPTLNAENQSVRVDAVFEGETPNVVANAAVEANIIIQKKDRVLTIPKTLMQGDSVKIQNADGKPQKVAVQTGIETTDFVEVLKGVDAKTVLIVK